MVNSKRIFISYSRRDESFARHLAADLDNLGADIWIDTDDIPPGMNWSTAVQQGLDLCDVMILIISPDSMASPNVENEWQYFMDQKKPIIPILWLPAKVHFQIRRLQYINFQTQSYPVALRQLRRVLRQQGIALGTGPDDSVNLPRQEPLPLRAETSPAPALRSYRQYWTIGAALAVLVAAAVIVLALNGGLGGGEGDKKATSTQPGAVAQEHTATSAPSLTRTPAVEASATPTPTATDTPVPTPTPTATSTDTPSPTITLTPSHTPTATQTPIPIETRVWLDITATQEAANAFASATAALWTYTPSPTFTPTPTLTPTATYTATPDEKATYEAELAHAIQTLTATMWTPTPTNTLTPTWTYTPSITPTPATTFTPSPLPAGASNGAWTPVEQDFGGVTMVYVPAGCFNMGSNNGDEDEQPVHEVCLDAFWIDKTEVTNGQYGSSGYFSGDQRPRENVTWFEAQQFCESRGARLPTEAEWEYAARGPEGWTYPWWSEWDGNLAVWNRSSSEGTAPVGSLPDGASWVGALDMSGNVWEWVNSLYQPYPYDAQDGRESNTDTSNYRALRGGSWLKSGTTDLRAALRDWLNPTYHGSNVGFRCARS